MCHPIIHTVQEVLLNKQTKCLHYRFQCKVSSLCQLWYSWWQPSPSCSFFAGTVRNYQFRYSKIMKKIFIFTYSIREWGPLTMNRRQYSSHSFPNGHYVHDMQTYNEHDSKFVYTNICMRAVWKVCRLAAVHCCYVKRTPFRMAEQQRAVWKVRGFTLLLGTLWRCGDSLFFEAPPLASDALLTMLHPLLKNVLQTVDHFKISCLRAPFSWLEKPRNCMGQDVNWILCPAWKEWTGGTPLEHLPYAVMPLSAYSSALSSVHILFKRPLYLSIDIYNTTQPEAPCRTIS